MFGRRVFARFTMEIPGLGVVKKDRLLNCYRSKPIPVPVLGNKKCQIVVSGYDKDSKKVDFHAAIANFLSITPSVLKDAQPFVFQYYRECKADRRSSGRAIVKIASAGKVFGHVRLGDKPVVKRRAHGDKGIYVSLSCECDWEQEHGLQI